MADIKPQANPLFLREDELRQGIELLFYAYRDFTAQADTVLEAYGFGRAHHRVIYFVGRNPGMPVSALLDILKITKQSLSRVLGQLLRRGFVQQRPGPDRRQRLLELTAQGAELERRLTEDQRALVARAYRAAGAEAVEGFRKVLFGMINEDDRAKVARSVMGSMRRQGGGPP
jgi:DNA-binding MarR family transcriptional regulator